MSEDELLKVNKLRYFPAYKLVYHKFRDRFDNDPVKIGFGYAFDRAVLEYNYEFSRGRTDCLEKAIDCFRRELRSFMESSNVSLSESDYRALEDRARGMLEEFSRSSACGKLRLKTRGVVVIGDEVIAMLVQPDFVGEDKIYEVKSFELKNPLQPEVFFQVRLFQLAYKTDAVVIGFKFDEGRPRLQEITIPAPSESEVLELVKTVYKYGLENGEVGSVRDVLDRPCIVYKIRTGYTGITVTRNY